MEKDRKEKVIGSWPGTCIQYTLLHTEEFPVRQKSAARRELKTEASWGEFLEWNIGKKAGRQKADTRNE